VEHAAERLVEEGVPQELARRVAAFGAMFSELDIVDVAAATDEPPEAVAEVYFTLGDRLKLHWLRGHVEGLPRDNRWRTLARAALRDDLYNLQASLTAEILRGTSEDLPAPERIEAWISANRDASERALQILSDVNASGSFELATLSVALREVRNLIPSGGVSGAEA
jgi:glutamate dehydrogenase